MIHKFQVKNFFFFYNPVNSLWANRPDRSKSDHVFFLENIFVKWTFWTLLDKLISSYFLYYLLSTHNAKTYSDSYESNESYFFKKIIFTWPMSSSFMNSDSTWVPLKRTLKNNKVRIVYRLLILFWKNRFVLAKKISSEILGFQRNLTTKPDY